jgi:hypothetical protein
MKRQDYHGQCGATIEVELKYGLTAEVEYSLTYTSSPYDRGDYWNPPSGGDVEDVEWKQKSMTIFDNEGDEIAFSLNEEEREEISKLANTAMDREAVETCREDLRNHYDD